MTGCEMLKCPHYVDGVCTDTSEYVNRETGEDMCSRNSNAVPKIEYWIKQELEKQLLIIRGGYDRALKERDAALEREKLLRGAIERVSEAWEAWSTCQAPQEAIDRYYGELQEVMEEVKELEGGDSAP